MPLLLGDVATEETPALLPGLSALLLPLVPTHAEAAACLAALAAAAQDLAEPYTAAWADALLRRMHASADASAAAAALAALGPVAAVGSEDLVRLVVPTGQQALRHT